jgi:hypothetical protein
VSKNSSTLPLLRPVSAALNSFVEVIESVRTGTHDPFIGFENSSRIDSLCYSQVEVVHVLVIAGPRKLTLVAGYDCIFTQGISARPLHTAQ